MKWLTLLFGAFLLLIIILADTGNLGILALMYGIPYADKLGHFILYGIMALLINLTLFRSMPQQKRLSLALMSGLVLVALIGMEEFSQQRFSSRTFSLEDLSASYLGVVFFSWLAIKTAQGKTT